MSKTIQLAVISGKGYQLLALFDVEYHASSAKITDVLMGNPNKKFKLSLKEIKKK